jgi:phosphoglycerol transferase MdoB-like AlkP superfamily enzyme
VQQVITVSARDEAAVDPIAAHLHDAFAARRAAGRKPLALVILLESLRPSETGYFAPDKPSLTPTLDAVHAHGITFTKALSTGSVTRGAQEAIFCGYLGSRDTSLMRGGAVARVDCLPDYIRRQSDQGGPKGDVFWFHGGEGRFDGQLEFWRSRGVGQLISLQDFPSDAPRTGWGVSDRTFFERAAGSIAKLRQDSPADYELGMLLSVTNHIPWDLPRDATVSPAANGELGHPSYYTTAYTDAAVGELLAGLRTTGVWQDALIVIASDHGNNVPPYADLYGQSPTRDTWLQSHVNLLLTGGLVDEALAAAGRPSLTIDRLVSQTDIATTLAAVAGVDARLMGESLFAAHRQLPVLADLEEGVFDPVDERLFRRAEVVGVALRTLSPGERKAMLYYRAFLQYINSWSGDTPG